MSTHAQDSPCRLQAALCVLLAATPAGAARPEAPPLAVIQVTATRNAASTTEVSQGTSVVGLESLRRHVPLTVVDHLRGEPGTFLQQTTPGQGIPIIRGLKGSEVLHLVDGFRLNNAIFRNAPNQYLALVDAWNLERIEVVRGPSSTLYGGDAMGGVAQFFSRTPSFEGHSLQSRGRAAMQWASSDERLASQLEGEIGHQNFMAHAGATWQNARELRVGGGERLPFTGFRSEGAYAKLHWNVGAADQLSAQLQFTKQPRTARYDALVPGFGQTHPDSSELRFEPQERWFAQARWRSKRETALADSVDLQLGAQRIIDDRVSRDYQSPHREFEHNASLLLGIIGHATRRIGAGHELGYGFEVYRDRVASARTRVNLVSGARSARPSRFPDGSTMSWLGAYVSERWTPHARLDVTAGVRFTRYDIDIAPISHGIGVRMTPQDLSGSAGIVFRATDSLNLVANAGRGFRPPNVFDIGAFGARGNRFGIPNPELDPESVHTYDFGVKYSNERVRAELIAFESDYHDKITQVLTGDVDPDGRLIVQARNATRLELRGVEADALWQPLEAVRLSATATWTWGEESFDSAGYPADRIPPLFGRLAAQLRVAPRWELEAVVDWAGAQRRLSPRDAVDPRIDPAGTAGWNTLALRAGWRPSAALRVALGVDNVADRRYREHGSGFDSPGRGATASFEWNF